MKTHCKQRFVTPSESSLGFARCLELIDGGATETEIHPRTLKPSVQPTKAEQAELPVVGKQPDPPKKPLAKVTAVKSHPRPASEPIMNTPGWWIHGAQKA